MLGLILRLSPAWVSLPKTIWVLWPHDFRLLSHVSPNTHFQCSECSGPHDFALISKLSPTILLPPACLHLFPSTLWMLWVLWFAWFHALPTCWTSLHFCHLSPSIRHMISHLFSTLFPLVSFYALDSLPTWFYTCLPLALASNCISPFLSLMVC